MARTLDTVHTHTHTHTHTPYNYGNVCKRVNNVRKENNLKNRVVLDSVAGKAEENKRNIGVINKDSLLHSKTRINTCFVM